MSEVNTFHQKAFVARALLVLVLLASFSIEALAQAGYVHEMSGGVLAQNGSRAAAAVKVGDTFVAGASFDTNSAARVVLKFADGQVVALGPDTTARIARYQFDARNIKGSSTAIELVNGAMRFVAGVIAADNREPARITAGASTISILGAGGVDFTLVRDTRAAGETVLAAVAVGAIGLSTPDGPSGRIETGQAVPWRPGQAPPPPVPVSALPAVMQAGVAAISSISLPNNSPVVVASAARAIAAAATSRQAQAAAAANPGNAQLQAAARAAIQEASSAAQASAAAAVVLVATIFQSGLATLPAPAAGPPPAAPVAQALQIAPITSTVTPAVVGCVGSRC